MAELNGRLYLIGGARTAQGVSGEWNVDVFDVASGAWLPPLPPSSFMPVPRGGIQAETVKGRIYVAGGFDGVSLVLTTRMVHVFDPSTNTWDEYRWMTQGRSHLGMVLVSGSALLAVGGTQTPFDGPGTNTTERLSVGQGCDPHEPDGALTIANPWAIFDPVGGGGVLGSAMTQARLCGASDVDLFVMNTTIGQSAGSATFSLTPAAGTDLKLEALDVNGVVVATSALPGSAVETVSYSGPQATPFYVRVSSQNGSFNATVPYRLATVP